jgi:uncharacterized glyoxalase superfamily protein PhnB
MPRLASICPVLVSPDVRRAVRWYAEVLGFRHASHLDAASRFATVYRDGIELVLVQAERGEVQSNERRHGAGFDAYLVPEALAEVDALHAELAGKGVQVREAPHLTAYGSREFSFEDCDGHVLGVGRIADEDRYFADSDLRDPG